MTAMSALNDSTAKSETARMNSLMPRSERRSTMSNPAFSRRPATALASLTTFGTMPACGYRALPMTSATLRSARAPLPADKLEGASRSRWSRLTSGVTIGQKNGQVRQWARRGTRPRQPADQRYDNAYLFGAICPARGVGAALALPYADADMMQLHLDEISRNVAEGAHAVLLLDRAGWHTTGKLDVPDNITPIFLPSRAPELNPVENVWQYLRQNWLSNTVFENYDAIVDAACAAWRKLIAQPETITSIGMRDWAHVDQPL